MKLINMDGSKWGKLTVIARADNLNGQGAWVCLCECGERSVVRGHALRNGTIRSCGNHRPEPKAVYCGDCVRHASNSIGIPNP